MRFNFDLKNIAVTLLIALLSLAAPLHAASGKPAQQAFASPEAAAKALADGIRAHDRKAVLSLFGQDAGKWLFSGDAVADRAAGEKFLAAYDRKKHLAIEGEGRATLLVGEDDWQFPAPLLKKANGWVFDPVKGKEEITNRRIGRNELDTIQTLQAIVDAQREYAAGDLDGNGFNDYAQRFISTAGERDGLYWASEPGERISPLGLLLAKAATEGYGKQVGVGRTAYHGYHYRILKAQGTAATGGSLDYIVKGKMLGGFAVLAYPAKYGVSGVMTFIVNHEGQVYQKNLGQATQQAAEKLLRFDPDASWQKAQ